VSISVSGQNERWAQLGAYQPPPPSQASQNSGWDAAIGTSSLSDPTGNAGPPNNFFGALSDSMSLALMSLNGWSSGATTPTQINETSSGASNASSTNSTSAGQAAITQGGTGSVSELVSDLQSLLAALTGTASPTNTTGTSGTAATSGTSDTTANSGTAAATALSSTVLQDLQAVASDLNSIAATSGVTQPPGGSEGPPPSSNSWFNDISNTGTASASMSTDVSNPGATATAQSPAGPWQGFMQQFAFSAYSAGTTSGLDSSTTSSLAAINV
jgi:hypothetical protein